MCGASCVPLIVCFCVSLFVCLTFSRVLLTRWKFGTVFYAEMEFGNWPVHFIINTSLHRTSTKCDIL